MPIRAIIKSASPLTMKKNSVYHSVQDFLLHQDDIQVKEQERGHISEVRTHHPRSSGWEKCRSLH
jgi:hypothetical protein